MGLKIAVTGGIGSGKSTVCKALSAFGYPVYDTDVMARSLMNSDVELMREIVAEFGDGAYANGQLDRAFIARQVFGSSERLARLNAIVHPAVVADVLRWASDRSERLLFVETALLFESGLDSVVDRSIAVVAPESLRIERVISRDGTTKEEVCRRMSSQMEQQELAARCDYTIVSDSVRPVLPQLERIVEQLEGSL